MGSTSFLDWEFMISIILLNSSIFYHIISRVTNHTLHCDQPLWSYLRSYLGWLFLERHSSALSPPLLSLQPPQAFTVSHFIAPVVFPWQTGSLSLHVASMSSHFLFLYLAFFLSFIYEACKLISVGIFIASTENIQEIATSQRILCV